MKRYNGGTEVRGGYYFHMGKWEITAVQGEKGTLPGDARQQFVRAPVLVLLVVAPVLGALFAIFLPLIGFGMPVYAAVKRLRAHEAGEASGAGRTA